MSFPLRGGPITTLLVAYDGSAYHGWQLQPNAATIQGELEGVLGRLHDAPRESVALVGSARTDAGVHAIGQVAAYHPPNHREPDRLRQGLNALLPEAIRVRAVATMSAPFHPCRSASGKIYRYRIVNREVVLPFEVRWAWQLWGHLEFEAMKEAAAGLVGTKDFAAVTNAGGQMLSTVRTMRRVELRRDPSGIVEIEFEADGFLYKMVRNLVGCLAEVGLGRRRAEDLPELLASGDRRRAGVAAPAQGLCLMRTLFPKGHGPAWGEDDHPVVF